MFLFNLLQQQKKGFINRILSSLTHRLFFYGFVGDLFKNYTLIDFHSYSVSYNNMMKKCVTNNISFDITLWGSDVMRASDHDMLIKEYGFNTVD